LCRHPSACPDVVSIPKKAVVFGATGMVGSEVLELCLRSHEIENVTTIGRRKTGLEQAKLLEIEHNDFLDYSSIERNLSGLDTCFYCLGVYQAQVSKEKFWEITVDYLDALIKMLEQTSPEVRFCLFSAQGASQSERSLMRFANAKGRAENIVLGSELAEKFIFRPGYIKPGPKQKKLTGSAKAFEPIYRLFPAIGVDANVLAKAIVEVGMHGYEKTILENRDLRTFRS
jgi:uncharacterized protein YbjT (DUF2867 family)